MKERANFVSKAESSHPARALSELVLICMVLNSSNFSLSFLALSPTPRRDQSHFKMQIASCESTAQEVFV